MVERLVAVLLSCASVAQIIVTKNVPETLSITARHQHLLVVENDAPKGFGANHNAAFRLCNQPYFCPLNPDIEFSGDVFQKLISILEFLPSSALVAPLVVSTNGAVEDSIRRFPTVRGLLQKALGHDGGHYLVAAGDPDFFPEWVAGMFMLFRRKAFENLGGFDEGFFLYYEDVDICVRAWKAGMKVVACLSVAVVHDARRESHKNLKYLRWHLSSITRYFWKHWGRLPRVCQFPGA